MRHRSCITIALTFCCVAAASARSQDPAATAPTVRELAQLVRASSTDAVERARALDALLELGIEGAEVAAKWAADAAKSIEHDVDKLRRQVLTQFDRHAAKLVRERMRRHEPEVAELRQTVLTNARDQGLSKETVVSVSDPALARLRELLTVSPHDVVDTDEAILGKVIEAEAVFDRLAEVWFVWERAIEIGTSGDGLTKTIAALPAPTSPSVFRDALQDDLQFHALLATPMPGGDADTLRENRELTVTLDVEERRGILACNHLRLILGLNALRVDLKLCDAAREHSADMVRLDFFAHESPVAGKHTPSDRAAQAGTSGGAENIARGHDTGAGAIEGWWYSPGHHRNMLGSHGRIGLGRAEDHWTQMFGG